MNAPQFLARFATILFAAGSLASQAAEPLPAEVVNIWTGAGERTALKVIADNYDAAGGKFINTPVPTGNDVMAMTVNRTLGGNPPTASVSRSRTSSTTCSRRASSPTSTTWPRRKAGPRCCRRRSLTASRSTARSTWRRSTSRA